jgi:hypothetical protein
MLLFVGFFIWCKCGELLECSGQHYKDFRQRELDQWWEDREWEHWKGTHPEAVAEWAVSVERSIIQSPQLRVDPSRAAAVRHSWSMEEERKARHAWKWALEDAESDADKRAQELIGAKVREVRAAAQAAKTDEVRG